MPFILLLIRKMDSAGEKWYFSSVCECMYVFVFPFSIHHSRFHLAKIK